MIIILEEEWPVDSNQDTHTDPYQKKTEPTGSNLEEKKAITPAPAPPPPPPPYRRPPPLIITHLVLVEKRHLLA